MTTYSAPVFEMTATTDNGAVVVSQNSLDYGHDYETLCRCFKALETPCDPANAQTFETVRQAINNALKDITTRDK